MRDLRLEDEEARLAALQRFAVLDTAPEPAFDRITGLVRSVLHVPIAAVSLIDRDRQWFKAITGLACSETPRSDAFCAHTIQQRRPLVVPDAEADPRFRCNALVRGAPNIRAYLGIPIAAPDGYNLGALCAIDRIPRAFSPREIELMQSFAALVVEHLELRLMAHSDTLTGAMTRRAFLARIEAERHRGGVVAILDLDHFKSINDQYGHAVGDEVLIEAVRACRAQMSPSDAIGRLGGEEFGVHLPGVSMAEAAATIGRMRAALAGLRFEFQSMLRVTASFGVSALDVGSATVSLAEADGALYAAKRDGRNRVVAAADLLKAA